MELFPGILCLSKDFKTLKAFSSQNTTEGFLDIEETKPLFICCATTASNQIKSVSFDTATILEVV